MESETIVILLLVLMFMAWNIWKARKFLKQMIKLNWYNACRKAQGYELRIGGKDDDR